MDKLEKIIKEYRKELDPYLNGNVVFDDEQNYELMKRAYNQALEDVKERAKIKIDTGISRSPMLDRESIDKLKIK